MKRIQPSNNAQAWPRKAVSSVECRKRDLVIRVADWSKDRDEPGYDVECYIGGVYDWNESKTCTVYEFGSLERARNEAVLFARALLSRHLS